MSARPFDLAISMRWRCTAGLAGRGLNIFAEFRAVRPLQWAWIDLITIHDGW